MSEPSQTNLAKVAALDQLRLYLMQMCDPETRARPSAANRQKHSRIFELCVAYELGLTLWECLPPSTFDTATVSLRRFMSHGGRPRDYGIDCADAALTCAAQAKWYAPGKMVTWHDISTFFTLGTAAHISKLTLVVSEGAKVVSLADAVQMGRATLVNLRIDAICAEALSDFSVASEKISKVFNGVDLSLFDEILDGYDISQDKALDTIKAKEPSGLIDIAKNMYGVISSAPLYTWQTDAVACLIESLKVANRDDPVYANVACGSGKSRLIIEIIMQSGYMPCVILVPAISLLEQFREEFQSWAPKLSVGLLGGGHDDRGRSYDVIVCTYHSAKLLSSAKFAISIVDEAHHAFDELVNGTEARVFADDIRSISYERSLLVSATLPTDEDNCAYNYDIGDAVRDGVIVDYHMIIPIFSPGCRRAGLRHLIKIHPEWTRVLAYCNTVAAAAEFTAECTADGILAATFSGDTQMIERSHIIGELSAGRIRVLVTVHTIGEGVNIREADTCMFVEPRGSHIDVTQCLGRIMRCSPHTGKSIATIIMPAIDEEKELARLMRILIGADRRLNGNGYRHYGRSSILLLKSSTVPDGINNEDAELLAINVYDRLGILLRDDSAWNIKLDILRDYVELHKQLPAARSEHQGTQIGKWLLTHQRTSYKLGTMKSHRITAIEAVLESVPGWTWEMKNCDESWQSNCDLLNAYVAEYGQLPPQGAEYHSVRLGSWVLRQKQGKKGQDNRLMTADRILALEAVPGWIWDNCGDDQWNRQYLLLCDYVDENKQLPPARCVYRSVNLGYWIVAQRQKGNGYKSHVMSADRVALLESVPGWTWAPDPYAGWRHNYSLIVEYMSESNRVPPLKCIYKGAKLGVWASRQRQSYKGHQKKSMPDEHIAMLNAISDWHW